MNRNISSALKLAELVTQQPNRKERMRTNMEDKVDMMIEKQGGDPIGERTEFISLYYPHCYSRKYLTGVGLGPLSTYETISIAVSFARENGLDYTEFCMAMADRYLRQQGITASNEEKDAALAAHYQAVGRHVGDRLVTISATA